MYKKTQTKKLNPDWKKILAVLVTDKGLICRIINSLRKNTPTQQVLNEQKKHKGNSQKRKTKCPHDPTSNQRNAY